MDQRERTTDPSDPNLDPDEVGLCNCCVCRVELIGEMTYQKLFGVSRKYWPLTCRHLFKVWRRVDGRPFCRACFERKLAQ